jgi:hypothetical protein
MSYGTLGALDSLRASQATIAAFGEDRAFEAIEVARQAHNEQFNEMLTDFIERTTDRQRFYGSVDSMEMDEVDEFGRADAEKIAAGVTIGFPMRLFQRSVQWTRKFMQNTTANELAAQFTAVQDAHIRRLQREIKRAIFKPTNSTFKDVLMPIKDQIDLAVKAFVNADSAAIPPGPNGESFDATTHTHYLARAGGAVVSGEVSGQIETVIEHHNTGQALLYINRAQEASVRAMTSNFTPYTDMRIVPGANTQTAQGNLDPVNLYNRAIGIYDGAEVWVKNWIPSGYSFLFMRGAPAPLVLRERAPGGANLQLAADDESHPLRARTMEAEFGVGVWNRTNGSVLYWGGTSYAEPVIS